MEIIWKWTSIKEIKSIIYNLPENKPQGVGDFPREFYHILIGGKNESLSESSREERVPNSFYEASNCLIPKQYNDITRKKKVQANMPLQNQLKNSQQN